MSLTLTPISHDELCHGSRWTIAAEALPELARQVALVALGQSRHVARILAGIDGTALPVNAAMCDGAIKLLTVKPGEDPWHRDGWVFQILSWIAAHRNEVGIVARAPHLLHAHKGFDGMQLKLNDIGNAVTAVVIFEDKATDSPRKTIHGDVWEGIRALESGQRLPELICETQALLEAQSARYPGLDIDAAIATLLWDQVRHYRVSISTSKTHASDVGRKRLFKGYDGVAPGSPARRGAETMHFDDLRRWMAGFANSAISQLETWKAEASDV